MGVTDLVAPEASSVWVNGVGCRLGVATGHQITALGFEVAKSGRTSFMSGACQVGGFPARCLVVQVGGVSGRVYRVSSGVVRRHHVPVNAWILFGALSFLRQPVIIPYATDSPALILLVMCLAPAMDLAVLLLLLLPGRPAVSVPMLPGRPALAVLQLPSHPASAVLLLPGT